MIEGRTNRPGARLPPLSPFVQRSLIAVALVLGVLGVLSRITTFTSDRVTANDFTQDYLSAKAWAQGDDPYAETGALVRTEFGPNAGYYGLIPPGQRNPHPPAFIVVHRPFAWLDYVPARALWLILMSIAIALAVALAARTAGMPARTAGLIGVASLALPATQKDLLYGQFNGVLLLLLVIAWRALRRGDERVAGVALGVAGALKFFPLFLVIPLIRTKRWRAIGWQIVSAASVGLVGLVALGPAATRVFVSEVAPWNFEYWRSAPMNIPLVAIPYRWLTQSPWRDGTLDLPALAALLSTGLLIACAVAAFRTRAGLSREVFWEAVPWMLLASPIVWDSYLILALPFVLLVVLDHLKRRVVPRWPVAFALAAVIVGAPAGLPVPQRAADIHQLLGYGLPTYGLVLLGIISARRRADTPDVELTQVSTP